MNKVSRKLIVLLIIAALVPMTVFGITAIWTARETARRIVAEENLEVAKRAAHQIKQYVDNGIAILEALAQNLGKTDLLAWQKERMIKNYVIKFEQFRSIDLADRSGHIIATSRLSPLLSDENRENAVKTALSGTIYRSEVFFSENFVPSMIVGIPVQVLGETQGAILGELNLIEMWRLVDSIRIGKEGYALVVSKSGVLIAHGLGSAKERILRQEKIGHFPIVEAALKGRTADMIYRDERGIEEIGVSVPIPELGWALAIEQPTREAYAAATRLSFHLTFLIGTFLLVMILIGTIGGRRSIVAPIQELIRGIRTVGSGNLADKVKISSRDEFKELGEAFNLMTERLSILQEDIRRNERAALLGRIASGLVHDLKHPIKNLENATRLLNRGSDNIKARDFFEKIARREFANLNRFLDDLLHLARPTPLQPILLNLSRTISDLLEPFRAHTHCTIEDSHKGSMDPAAESSLLISVKIDPPDLKIWADRFALERVLRNLIVNATEAMPQGGRLEIIAKTVRSIEIPGYRTEIAISDTGHGMPPERLRNLFVDYSTTKRKGIGLGLAICKKIMEEHKGTIEVRSQPGYGTTVTLQFPSPI
jgi:signal transduction histidine kinase